MGRTGHRTRQTRADTDAGYVMQLAHGGWREVDWSAAACRDADPELFFPIGEGELARRAAEAAKALCARCRLTEQCLEWAVATGMSEGIWGGHTERERRLLRRRVR